MQTTRLTEGRGDGHQHLLGRVESPSPAPRDLGAAALHPAAPAGAAAPPADAPGWSARGLGRNPRARPSRPRRHAAALASRVLNTPVLTLSMTGVFLCLHI